MNDVVARARAADAPGGWLAQAHQLTDLREVILGQDGHRSGALSIQRAHQTQYRAIHRPFNRTIEARRARQERPEIRAHLIPLSLYVFCLINKFFTLSLR